MDPLYVVLAIAVVGALGLLRRPGRRRDKARRAAAPPSTYPGDFVGKPTVEYAPDPDGQPDPGEIVWTWVPYQEDHTQGKDRPVLLIGRDHHFLLGLMLSSKDHDHDPRARDQWMDIGSGPWDRRGRPSEVRLDRIIRVAPYAVRREGAVLDRHTFDEVKRSLFRANRW